MTKENNKPNLLYIFADQWRRQAMGFMNDDPVITPNIDIFAQESVVFDNAISCFPLCTPHRGSLLTGRYPLSLGLDTNCRTGLHIMLSPEEVCIGNVLKGEGYNTGYIGKWHLDEPELNHLDAPESGAKRWDAYTPPGPKRQGFDYWYSYGACDKHLHPHYWKDTPEKIEVDQWSVEHETDIAIDYIKNHNSNNPFALFISWNPPHTPFDQTPEKYKKMYEGKQLPLRKNISKENLKSLSDVEAFQHRLDYFAAVTGVDDNFGRIINFLKQNGLEENTIVVLSADHGEMLGSHGQMHKHIWYEESIGIPFLIRWKNKLAPKREKMILNSMDQMPTLLGMMDLAIPNTVEGTDCSSIAFGREESKDTLAFICGYTGSEKEKTMGIEANTTGWRGIRSLTHTYVVFNGYEPNYQTERLLYDNAADPYQMNPIVLKSASENLIAEKLEKELKIRLKNINDPFLL